MANVLKCQKISLAAVPQTDVSVNAHDGEPVVLVVDNDRVISDTRVAIFESWGCAAFAANDAESALAIAEAKSPSLLIAEIALGGLGGIHLADEIRKIAPKCEVILISGDVLTHAPLIHRSGAGNNFTVLTKPVRPVELAACIERLDFASLDNPSLPPLQGEVGSGLDV